MDDLEKALARSVFGASADALNAAVQVARSITVQEGKPILLEGARDTKVYVLVRGRASVEICDKRGKTHWLDEMAVGALIGEMAPLASQPRSATVVAREPSVLAVFEGRQFKKLIKDHGAIGLEISKLLALRLAQTNRRVPEVVSQNVAPRLLARYRQIASPVEGSDWGMIDSPPAKTLLAEMISCSRETASRAHKKLLNQGMVKEEHPGGALFVHLTKDIPSEVLGGH